MKKPTQKINKDKLVSHLSTGWQRLGDYEHEYNQNGYTGRYRAYQGMMANGIHPAWDNNGVQTPS